MNLQKPTETYMKPTETSILFASQGLYIISRLQMQIFTSFTVYK